MHIRLADYEPILIYSGAIAACLLSILWNPRIGFYYLVPLLPMQTVRYWVHDFPWGEKLVDFLLVGVLVGALLHCKRPIFAPSRLNRALALFIALTYISLWQGSFYLGKDLPLFYLDPRFSDWKNFVEMMLIFFIAAAVVRRPKHIIVLIVLMCLSVLMINREYHSTVGGRDYSHFSYDMREAGVLGYAGENGMGAFQAEFAVFLLGLAVFAKRRILKLGLLAIAGTSIYCLVLTFSRGGYLGFLAGLLAIGLLADKRAIVALLIILIGWQAFVPNAVRERVLSTYQEGEGLESSAQERVQIWQDAVSVIQHNPFLGTGFDTYKFMGRVGPYEDTHNYYLKVFLEMGTLGLLLFLWLLGAACKVALQLYRSSTGQLLKGLGCASFAMIACAMVVNFFGDRWSFLQVNGFLWVLLGCAARGLLLIAQAEPVIETQQSYPLASCSGPAEYQV